MKSLIVLLIGLAWAVGAAAASPEEDYWRDRDRFVQSVERTGAREGEQERVHRVLEAALRRIVGPIRVAGFRGSGALNGQTLKRGDEGSGQAEGLFFLAPGEKLFVTTEALLHRYLAEQGDLPRSLDRLAGSEDFYRRVFAFDLAYIRFAEIPVRRTGGFSLVRACLTLNAQDWVPHVPQTLVVFAVRRGRVALHESEVPVAQIAACQRLWEGHARETAAALKRYQDTRCTDRQAWGDYRRLDREAFEAYRGCFSAHLKEAPFFPTLVDRVQSVVNRLRDGI